MHNTRYTMTTVVEEITPAKAKQYLEHNKRNRPLKSRVVTNYARKMKAGKWALAPDGGISFDTNGDLVNGQHRLHGIIEADVTVAMQVTRNAPIMSGRNNDVRTQDAMDGHGRRLIAQQLSLDGISNGAAAASNCTVIVQISVNPNAAINLDVTQVKEIYEIYGKHIHAVAPTLYKFRPCRGSGISGLLAYARETYRNEVDDFTEALSSGENLRKGNPILTLRNRLISGVPSTGGTARIETASLTAAAFYASLQKKSLHFLRPSEEALNHLRAKQRGNIAKVHRILGLNC